MVLVRTVSKKKGGLQRWELRDDNLEEDEDHEEAENQQDQGCYLVDLDDVLDPLDHVIIFRYDGRSHHLSGLKQRCQIEGE